MTADEVIKGVCTASAAGDFAGVAAHFASDAVVFGTLGGVDQEVVLRGPDALTRYFADVAATWDEWHVEAERVLRNDVEARGYLDRAAALEAAGLS